jgi:hypothetical protein
MQNSQPQIEGASSGDDSTATENQCFTIDTPLSSLDDSLFVSPIAQSPLEDEFDDTSSQISEDSGSDWLALKSRERPKRASSSQPNAATTTEITQQRRLATRTKQKVPSQELAFERSQSEATSGQGISPETITPQENRRDFEQEQSAQCPPDSTEQSGSDSPTLQCPPSLVEKQQIQAISEPPTVPGTTDQPLPDQPLPDQPLPASETPSRQGSAQLESNMSPTSRQPSPVSAAQREPQLAPSKDQAPPHSQLSDLVGLHLSVKDITP